jgi:hypothetical protein
MNTPTIASRAPQPASRRHWGLWAQPTARRACRSGAYPIGPSWPWWANAAVASACDSITANGAAASACAAAAAAAAEAASRAQHRSMAGAVAIASAAAIAGASAVAGAATRAGNAATAGEAATAAHNDRASSGGVRPRGQFTRGRAIGPSRRRTGGPSGRRAVEGMQMAAGDRRRGGGQKGLSVSGVRARARSAFARYFQ